MVGWRIYGIVLMALLLTGSGRTPLAWAEKGESRIENYYEQVTAEYNRLLADSRRVKVRKNWQAVGQAFARVYKEAPNCELAPVALFNLAKIQQNMSNRFGKAEDWQEAVRTYEEMAAAFPNHPYADDALQAAALLYRQDGQHNDQAARTLAKIIALYPNGDMVATATAELTALKSRMAQAQSKGGEKGKSPAATAQKTAGGNQEKKRTAEQSPPPVAKSGITGKNKPSAKIVDIRNWSTKDYTRVVIETTAPIAFKEELFSESPEQPRRVAVTLLNCRLAGEPKKTIQVQDGLLKQVRSAQFDQDTVRVVLDTESLSDYKVFDLQNPARLIIDVKGKPRAVAPTVTKSTPPAPASATAANPPPELPSLARQLGLGVKRIIIDPGHGGKDPGALGSDGMQEKDIVLQVGTDLAQKLRQQLGCEVVLTRDRDVFIPLEERTAIANTREGDLFISIHVNAAPSTKARGIETYFLDLAVNKEAMRVAARENASSSRQLSDLQGILKSLMQNTKIKESTQLATTVQEQMVTGMNKHYGEVQNLGIKKAPFIVLIGAQMPAILVELAFLSNPQEAKRLRNQQYLHTLSDQLAAGIVNYASELTVASGARRPALVAAGGELPRR